MSNEDWQKILAINFSSVFYGCKHSIPYLKKNNGGSIINIASVQAHTPLPGWAAYAGIKGGVISMTRNIASEFGPFNIRANTISPGTVATEMVNQVVENYDDKETKNLSRVQEDLPFNKLSNDNSKKLKFKIIATIKNILINFI